MIDKVITKTPQTVWVLLSIAIGSGVGTLINGLGFVTRDFYRFLKD